MAGLKEERHSGLGLGAGVQAGAQIIEGVRRAVKYRVVARDPQGKIKWIREFPNLVVNAGLDDSLDQHLKGSNYTAAWYVGLTDGTPTVAAGDTMASHAGWVEVVAYDEAVRQTLTLGAVSGQSVDNTSSKAVFTISANDTTIGGAFVADADTRGGTAAATVLYGAGAFTAADKTIDNDDTLTVTVTLTAAAA